jgi:hypothetical protein
MNLKLSSGFHSYYASNVLAYQTYTAGSGWGFIFPHPITIENRSLTYRFYPHFHPYVRDLVKRLNTDSVAGLEAADTDYVHNGDGSLRTLANSTRATLSAATQVTRISDNSSLSLLAGAPLTLVDGSSITIPSGTTVTLLDGTSSTLSVAALVKLSGSIPASFSSGTQFVPASGPAFILAEDTAATVAADTQAALSDGTLVTLVGGTNIELRSGIPLPTLYQELFSATNYGPSNLVQQPFPVKDLDFTVSGAYSIYNWELFFHVPLLIAIHLSQNQKFQDAQTWFHYIFDPTDDSNGPTPQRFWKVRPFQTTDVELIENILTNLSTGADPQLQQDTITAIEAWKNNPFQPFVVGRYRPTSFMFATVMAYLDNLIAWGDSLFQQYTGETVNEATQLYVLAANILGQRPQVVPKKGSLGSRTYADLRSNLDPFNNALVDMEVDVPFDLAAHPTPSAPSEGAGTLSNIAQTLYFCVPQNDKLLSYWDTVADRLFKIHNSLNLQGVFQPLPLFEPPIDPALLVRATAAGLDVSAVVSGLNQPLPLVRFRLLVLKATEICQEVKSLGGNVLAAMEKQDNEALALLRAQHETIILGLAEMVKYAQWQDSIKAREALEQSLANATDRYTYYQKLLGRTDSQIQATIPPLESLDTSGLNNLNFQSNEPQMPPDMINVDTAQNSTQVSDGEVKTLTNFEAEELDDLKQAQDLKTSAGAIDLVAKELSLIPQFGGKVQPMGAGADITFGGIQLSTMMSMMGSALFINADQLSYQAKKAEKLGGYARREYEWTFQSNAAKGEINQIFKQLRGAQIREAIAQKEYQNHQTQMQQAQDIEDFLQGKSAPPGFQLKETTIGFYAWMKRQAKALYAQAFQLAFDIAKKAERALQHELGDSSLSYIQFNYLDGIEGLFAGEKLLADVKRMEMDYHDLNQREYELTKHVSLLQVAPLALLQLRANGSCMLALPEELFDLDCPGHYFRRIKSVAVSIPCVTGSYTSVNCTLTLLNSSIRTSSQLSNNNYPRSGPNDPRFSDYFGSIQAIVTSSGQADSGLFEANLNDERYLPFELSGVVSQWRLDLPADVRQFDFDTISDVILHVRYTAREGGDLLKTGAVANLKTLIAGAQTVGSVRLFSVRHEFPSEWAKFRGIAIGGTTPTAGLSLTLLPQHYPFWAQSFLKPTSTKSVALFAQMLPTDTTVTVNLYDKADKTGNNDMLNQSPAFGGLLAGNLNKIALPAAVTDATHLPLTLYFDSNSMRDLWFAITWGKG